MSKDEELQKHTLLLYRGDYERLRLLFPEIGAAVVVRKLIHTYLNQFGENKTPDLDVEIGI